MLLKLHNPVHQYCLQHCVKSLDTLALTELPFVVLMLNAAFTQVRRIQGTMQVQVLP